MIIKYRTKSPVTHLDIDKMVEGGQRQGVVTILIGSHNIVNHQKPDMSGYHTTVEVAYEYNDDNGKTIPTNDNGVFKLIDEGSVKALSQSINGSLSVTDNIVDRLLSEVKIIAAQKLSERFGLDISEVEEVIE